MAEVFLIVSSLVFIVSGIWFLLRPQWWANAIRESRVYGPFWTSPTGMAINRILAVIAILVGVLFLIGSVS